jgi:hypothetical protein
MQKRKLEVFYIYQRTLPSPPLEDHTQSYQAYNNQSQSTSHLVPIWNDYVKEHVKHCL